jgi:hypothetical protein
MNQLIKNQVPSNYTNISNQHINHTNKHMSTARDGRCTLESARLIIRTSLLVKSAYTALVDRGLDMLLLVLPWLIIALLNQ